ncbi:DUF3137 domain-containing protein [Mesomycoplasma ovipneumoniae]|uniref:hypothetical protein n=1 Tax=Mesomycoplasma ovipneumoniae TaxID=29562 RepID=UPI00296410E8|nr:hypothetical protein [Mesomycoplasma ovipneumoniae]MDW2908069.1 DUF3137 domain-containing protein [Mesomycoplasma ovipneumoniae]MDW2922923.1 DUF3137 domain-containing protein [Mesomycoplasma ovipneumoniae]MDW2932219.1 DUF3137 domain-containing protein [Mesomycoplasma ovipneumoniae]
MKIINDYFKFEDYKNKAKEEFRPKLDEIIKKKHLKTLEKLAGIQRVAKKLEIVSLISYIFISAGIYVAIKYELGIGGIIFAVISGIIAIASTFYLGIKKREIRKITNEVSKDVIDSFKPEVAYKAAFSILDKGMEYLGFNDQPSNNIQISKNEISNLTPVQIIGSSKAWISEVRPLKELLIDEKFRVSFTNVRWQWEERRKKETVTKKSFTGILKIDTSILGEKAFDFKLLKPNGWLSQKEKIQLENEEFNKVFNPQSSDRLKIRKMYTPLAMELSLKRYSDRNGVKVLDVAIESLGNAIYFTYKCDWNFMYLDFPTSIIKTPDDFINHIFNDFLLDTYSLYYLLCLIYVTLYLD